MHKILFVCLGNICRSTMAQSVFQNLVNTADQSAQYKVDSAGTSDEEQGNPAHPGTQRILREKHIPYVAHHARQIRPSDYEEFDYIIYMDTQNKRALDRAFQNDPQAKCHALLEYAPYSYTKGRVDVADPWWTGNFDVTYADIEAGCKGLLHAIQNTKNM